NIGASDQQHESHRYEQYLKRGPNRSYCGFGQQEIIDALLGIGIRVSKLEVVRYRVHFTPRLIQSHPRSQSPQRGQAIMIGPNQQVLIDEITKRHPPIHARELHLRREDPDNSVALSAERDALTDDARI